VAGFFYPAEARRLAAEVDGYIAAGLHTGDGRVEASPVPKVLIAPHAGYRYSGPVAGAGYARLDPARASITRVVLVGPAHHLRVEGLAVSGAGYFATPLGLVPVDASLRDLALGCPGVVLDDAAHAPEHSLEVHLPFLQRSLDSFSLLPLVAGRATPRQVADVLEAVWGGSETLIVVSTDLSHYHDYSTAQGLDRRTADAIVHCAVEAIGPYDACGAVPVRGVLEAARRQHLHVELVDLRTSGDTAGPKDRVVGYGAFIAA
jgi:AmmeMemoRadiSam system protein B